MMDAQDKTAIVVLILWAIGVLISLGVTGFVIWLIWKAAEKYILS